MSQPQDFYRPPAPPRPLTAFWMHVARGIAYGVGVSLGVLLVFGTLGLLLAAVIAGYVNSQ